MNIFEAIIQGVVQGLTEFLPVSSSGHLSITQHIIGVTDDNLFFNVMLHIGTLIAVCAFYYKLIWRLIKAFFSLVGAVFTGKFSWKNMDHDRRLVIMLVIGLVPLFLLFAPIPGTDMKIKDLADIFTADKYLIIVAISLLVTSLLLLIGIICNNKMKDKQKKDGTLSDMGPGRLDFTLGDAITVGLVQCVAAIFPGLSRSGSTFSAGQMRGLNKQTALDYTFVLAIPSILAAAVLELKDAFEAPDGISMSVAAIAVGMIVSAIIGYLSIALFKWLLKTDKTYIFVIYTAVVGLACLVVSIIELTKGYNLFTGTLF